MLSQIDTGETRFPTATMHSDISNSFIRGDASYDGRQAKKYDWLLTHPAGYIHIST